MNDVCVLFVVESAPTVPQPAVVKSKWELVDYDSDDRYNEWAMGLGK